MSEKSIGNELWEKELWTQKEVANYFRVVQGTVINWRNQGLLSYWQAPGSAKILYFRDEIKDFRNQNTTLKKGGGKPKAIIKREKPRISSTSKEWRI